MPVPAVVPAKRKPTRGWRSADEGVEGRAVGFGEGADRCGGHAVEVERVSADEAEQARTARRVQLDSWAVDEFTPEEYVRIGSSTDVTEGFIGKEAPRPKLVASGQA